MSIRKHPPKSEVKQLMFLLTFSIITSFLLVVGMLWHFNPDGRLEVEEVLISPETVVKLPKTVHHIEWNGRTIDLATFEKIYDIIEDDVSLHNPPENLMTTQVDTLSIVGRDGKKIQAVKFSGHYFIVEGHQQESSNHTYYHPDVQEAIQAVLKK